MKQKFVILGVLLLLVPLKSLYAENCPLPTISNVSPHDGVVDSALMPELRIAIEVPRSGDVRFFGLCDWTHTAWQVVEDTNDFYDFKDWVFRGISPQEIERIKKQFVFLQETRGANLHSVKIPNSVLKPGRTYWWRASACYVGTVRVEGGGVIGGSSGGGGIATVPLPECTNYSRPTSFSTTMIAGRRCGALPQPVSLAPRHNSTGISQTPTLQILSGTVTIPTECAITEVEWQLSEREEFTPAQQVSAFSGAQRDPTWGYWIFEVPAQVLQAGGEYWWRARTVSKSAVRSDVISPWSSPAHFSVSSTSPVEEEPPCPGLNSPSHVSPADGGTSSPTPILEVVSRGLSPGCYWDETAWQVLDADNGDYVYQTGFVTQRKRVPVPPGVLQPGKRYVWRVKIAGRGQDSQGRDVFSPWSGETSFVVR